MDLSKLDRFPPKDETDSNDPNNRNPYIFVPAEWFFKDLASAPNVQQPSKVFLDPNDQFDPVCNHGKILQLQDDGGNRLGYLLIQFMRPTVWRIRFHSVNDSPHKFTDFNSRTLVQDTLSKMIQILDIAEKLTWSVELLPVDDTYYVLQSVKVSNGVREIAVQLWIQRHPFKIMAVRSVPVKSSATPIIPFSPNAAIDSGLKFPSKPGEQAVIIWQTKEKPLQWFANATILSIEKPQTSRYTGFGEQGGRGFFKNDTVMNYFNFDNMRYYNVYGMGNKDGPWTDSEPLYHSEAYWIELNAHPGALSQVGTFVDNYSQICIDLGRVNPSLLRMATRFNSFQSIFMAGDDIGQIIRSYTSLIGRPHLKPRFILGAHQGCYGYDTRALVEEAVDKYRKYDVPLDGMHIDVDMQRDYRTFTIDTRDGHFPDPKTMFTELRKKGVKCSTNITPVISIRNNDGFDYKTYTEGYEKKYFVKDVRDVDPGIPDPRWLKYINFGGGNRWMLDPNVRRPDYGDNYNFPMNFNSGYPFHGGVDYGGGMGSPGFYPNLMQKQVRRWWGEQYTYLFETGLEFVWQDMTSPCMSRSYGDMQSWPFRLLLDNDGWTDDPPPDDRQRKAIEIWSLYSYNLHKATFKGLQRLDSRKGKRNFIVGRGSFAGAQRYAGLWTGDNVSSWEFLDISVAQVLALGLAGATISGADVGGFEPNDAKLEIDYCDPELLIRWYSAYSLLPWLRNHYVRKGKKHFQEPYGYLEFQMSNSEKWQQIPESERNMYYSVLPATRYILKLRYSLLQLMYDTMFENLITGLPLARAMVITDPYDDSLFGANQPYTRSQYLVGNDLLVAPALYRERVYSTRKLYLPSPDRWYPMNLRAESSFGVPLAEPVNGGTYVFYNCSIGPNADRVPYITPMYIREGAIIPQIQSRMYVPDRTRADETQPFNPITLNIYPGKDNSYKLYLDDGVSRASAPSTSYLSNLSTSHIKKGSSDLSLTVKSLAATPDERLSKAYGDPEAKDQFRMVVISQSTTKAFDTDRLRDLRTVTVQTLHDGYGDQNVERDIGTQYQVMIWHPVHALSEADYYAKLDVHVTGTDKFTTKNMDGLNATLVTIPTSGDIVATIQVSSPA